MQFAVIAHRSGGQLAQAFDNITCKSVPSPSENLGLRALSELLGLEILPQKIFKNVQIGEC